MAVCRSFYRMMKTALFALLVCFTTLNAFANCQYVSPGYACIQDTAVECAPGCYCPGGSNVSSSQEAAVLQGSCNAATPGSSITGGAVRCPSGTSYSLSGAMTELECYDTYSSYTPQFYVETTADTTEFDFIIQASGTFYIDCDVNNVGGLASTERKKKYVSRGGNDQIVVRCRYSSSGKNYKIGIASENVTRYPFMNCSDNDACYNNYYDGVYYGSTWSSSHDSVIRFLQLSDSAVTSTVYDTEHIYKISGSLGKVFPTLGTSHPSQQPAFEGVFENATNLTGTLPTNLFTGDCVYNSSTKKCSSGKGIYGPPSARMFERAFSGCSGLQGNIPDYFFGHIYGAPARDMFQDTFYGCSGLQGGLSNTWFGELEGDTSEGHSDYNGDWWVNDGLFDSTFFGCSGLTGTIPENFFGRISGVIEGDCGDGEEDTFYNTFRGCTNLSGTVPYDLFSHFDDFLKDNDYGTKPLPDDRNCGGDDADTFENSGLNVSCADDEYQYVSGLEYSFGNRGVICKKCPSGTYGTGGKNITSCITDTHFTITTTNMDAGTEFKFMISALGSYRVDWGDGNESVMSTDVEGVEDDDSFYFSHTYTTGGFRTIKVYGNTLAYSNETEKPAISFYAGTAYNYIEKITGSIGDVFPTVSSLPSGLSTDDFETHPGFYQMCKECSNLNSIGSDLFSGVTGAIDYMFEETFYGCFDLTIPSGLFSGITGNAQGLFYGTFYDCDSIESVPPGLFSGISGAAPYMFEETFYSCESLKTIPANLFSGVRGAASSLFDSTFYECSSLEAIPSGLFSNVSGAASSMFYNTFYDCDSLTSIPRGLFDGVNQTAEYLFYNTFNNCDGLTSIPADLFKNISGTPQKRMFMGTFEEATSVTEFKYSDNTTVSYIPPTFFGALENSSYTTPSNQENWVAQGMFANNEHILETCPAEMTEFNSKFKTEYAPKVSCVPTPSYNINYVLDGGSWPSGSSYPTNVLYNHSFDIIGVPTRSGFVFGGWNITDMQSGITHYYTHSSAWTSFTGETLFRTTAYRFYNLRTDDGQTVTFTAVWKKSCSGGTYYNPTTQTCTDCPSGSYCYGGTGYTDTPQIVGKETCPTGFTSNAKNSDITGCYKNGTTTCAVANPVAVAENASSVKYATTGNIACKIYPEDDYDEDNEHFTSCIIDNPDACEVIGMNCNTGYTSTQVDSELSSKNIPDTFSDYAYVSVDPDGDIECHDREDCYRTDKPNGVYDVWLNGYGVVRGRSLCSSTPGTNGQIGTPSLSNGQYCWCKTTLFKENDNDAWLPAVSSWVRETNGDVCTGSNYESYEYCIQDCSYDCAYHILSESSSERTSCSVVEQTVRSTLFNSSKTYICQPITYTVSFNTNGGTGGPGANITATYDVSFNVASPTRSGYTFAGWNISGMDNSTHLYGNSSGHAEESNNSTSVTNTNYTWYQNLRASAETVTFTAQWTQNSYVVTYHAGYDGGTDPGAANYTVGGDPVTLPNITRSGYALNGWYTAASGGTKAGDAGAEYRPEGNVDLYARWSATDCQDNAHVENGVCVCNSGTIIYNNNGNTVCAESKFELTTVQNTSNFNFVISAKGEFYIDWGDGIVEYNKTLNADQVNYSHDYTQTSGAGQYTIRFGGLATEYNENVNYGAIIFGTDAVYNNATSTVSSQNAEKILRISGSLGAIFPTIDDTITTKQPSFIRTFMCATNLESGITSDLFNGVYGQPRKSMFAETFSGCSSWTGPIPDGLFAGIQGHPVDGMYEGAFENCSSLTGQIPDNLFGDIDGAPAIAMYAGTFANCSNLRSTIPQGLFGNIHGDPGYENGSGAENMFAGTFLNCSKLYGSIPYWLFGYLSGAITPQYVFTQTFKGCSGLTGNIPAHLLWIFASGYIGWEALYETFSDCSGLTGFVDETTGKVTSFVPKDYFSNLTYGGNNEYSHDSTNIFDRTGIAWTCPVNTYKYTLAFEESWGKNYTEYQNGKNIVSCDDCPISHPSSDGGIGGIEICYRTCPETIADCPEHAVCSYIDIDANNRDYYESGEELSCDYEIIDCQDGYTLEGGVCVKNIIKYTVTYDVNGGDAISPSSVEYTVGGTPVTLPTPHRTSHSFDGWYTAANGGTREGGAGSSYEPNGNITLYAHWTLTSCPENAHIEGSECVCNEGYSGSPCSPITYNIRYEGMEDATFGTNHPTTATYNKLFTVDNPTKTGYKFTGWSMYLLPGTAPESVAYNVNGETSGVSITAVPGEEATFIYYAENLIQFKNLRKTNSSTVKLTARWTEIICDNTQYFDEATNSCLPCPNEYPNSVNGVCSIEKSCPALVCPEHSTCSYIGATTWIEYINEPTTEHCQIQIEDCDTGYTSNGETCSPITYNITYAGMEDATFGTNHPTTATYNKLFTVDNPTKPGYRFTEWSITGMDESEHRYGGDSGVSNITTSTTLNTRYTIFKNLRSTPGTTIFTAQWTPNTYTVRYDINYSGGTNPADATYTVGGNAITLPTVTRTGYDFYGWYTEPVAGDYIGYDESTYEPSSDITLYAHWELEEIDYTIYCNSDKEEMENLGGAQTDYGEDLNLDFIKENLNECSEYATHSVSGWMCNHRYDDNVLPVDFGNTGSVSWTYDDETEIACFPKWTPNTYTVTYEINYNGGTNPESTSYTYGNSAITLPMVNRDGYNFDGWYTASNGGNKVTSPYTPTGNITLYAHWRQSNINLLYKYNDINNTETTDMCVYDGSPFRVPRPSVNTIKRPGYRFMGWKYNKNIQ